MPGPVEPPNTRQMHFGPSVPPGVGAESIPRGEVVLAVGGVEWLIKDPPLLSLVGVKWWGQEGEGTAFRISTKISSHLVTPASHLVFPAMCGPKNLAAYFHDMQALTLEVLDGTGPTRIVGRCEVNIQDLVRLASISGDYQIATAQKVVGTLSLALTANFFPTVVTSFELNEHQAEADMTTPLLPTNSVTTWREATAASAEGKVQTLQAQVGRHEQQEPITTAVGERESAPHLQQKEERREKEGVSLEQAMNREEAAQAESTEEPHAEAEQVETQTVVVGDSAFDKGLVTKQQLESNEQDGKEMHGSLQVDGVASKSCPQDQMQTSKSGLVGTDISKESRNNLDDELRVLIGKAEKLREAMTEACKDVQMRPSFKASSRLAKLELPLMTTEGLNTVGPPNEYLRVHEAQMFMAHPDAVLESVLDTLNRRDQRRPGRSKVMRSPEASSDSEEPSEEGSLAETWTEADSDEDAYGVAEDELISELFFTEKGAQRREETDEEGGMQRSPQGGALSSAEHASKVRLAIGHVLLSDPPATLRAADCTLTLSFPAVPSALSDIAPPPQSISIVPTKASSNALVFHHSAEFPVRMSDDKVRQPWKFGELQIELCMQQGGEKVRCRGSLPLEDVLKSVPAPCCTSVPLYVQQSEGHKGQREHSDLAQDVVSDQEEFEAAQYQRAAKQNTGANSAEGLCFGTVDLEIQLLSCGRGKASRREEQAANEIEDATNNEAGSESLLYLQTHGLETREKEGGQLRVVAKAGRPGGKDAVLQDVKALRGFGSRGVSLQTRAEFVAAPKGLSGSRKEGMLVLEVWNSREALLGIVRVPLKRFERGERLRGLDVLVQAWGFEIWDPFTSKATGALCLSAFLGDAAIVQHFHKEQSAALLIQRCFRGFAARRRFRALLGEREDQGTCVQQGSWSLQGTCVQHTFRVTVVSATGLPTGEALYSAELSNSAPKGEEKEKKAVTFAEASEKPSGCRFVKYWFPGETEPLYTRDVDWEGSPQFDAQAWHRITLPLQENIQQSVGWEGQHLSFEVWDRLELRGGEDSQGEERLVGTAVLSMADVLQLAARRGVSSHEVTKDFAPPLRLAEGIPPGKSFPRLHVTAAYSASAPFSHPLAGTLFAPRGKHLSDLPLDAVLNVHVIRAAGLQAAAAAAVGSSPSLRSCLQSGVHSYVRLSLFPSNHDLELQYPPIHTPLQAQTFTPHYDFRRHVPLHVTEEVLQALKSGAMAIEVWHHAPRALREESTNSWLGTVSVPLKQLLTRKAGIQGWFDIRSRRGDVVGAIELHVAFSEWRPSQPTDSLPAPSILEHVPSPHPFPEASQPSFFQRHSEPKKAQEQGVILTVSVEEVVLPPEKEENPKSWPELSPIATTSPARYYAVHERYGEQQPCVSRAVQAHKMTSQELHVPLGHSCQTTAVVDEALQEYLHQRLAIEVWKVDTKPSSSRGSRDRLIGTAYVGLTPLLDHGSEVLFEGRKETKRAASMSGEFALIHPDASDLMHARVTVRLLLEATTRVEKEAPGIKSLQESELDRRGQLEAENAEFEEQTENLEVDGRAQAWVDQERKVEELIEQEGKTEEMIEQEREADRRVNEESDDDEWLQQRAEEALRRSAGHVTWSKKSADDEETPSICSQQSGEEGVERQLDSAPPEIEKRNEDLRRSGAYLRAQTLRQDEGERQEVLPDGTGGQTKSAQSSRKEEAVRGPAKRLAGHVTITAPPPRQARRQAKEGPATDGQGRKPDPSLVADELSAPFNLRTEPGFTGDPAQLPSSPASQQGVSPPAVVHKNPPGTAVAHSNAPFAHEESPHTAVTGSYAPGTAVAHQNERDTAVAHSTASIAHEGSLQIAVTQKGASMTAVEERYTNVRVCIEAGMNLQYFASHSHAEQEYWAGLERLRESSFAPTTKSAAPQGLFVSYRWQETGEVIHTPLVTCSSSPRWYHCRHVPLARPSKKTGEKILVLKVWKRLGETAVTQAQEVVQDLERDRLIGCAAIDLSPLFLGMEELSGWYTVHDLRQHSLGQLKVTVAPVDSFLAAYRDSCATASEADMQGGQTVRLRSPPQRGPSNRGSPKKDEWPERVEEGTWPFEEELEGGGLGRQSSMEDVHQRLEELQELSRQMLHRRGLVEDEHVATAEDTKGMESHQATIKEGINEVVILEAGGQAAKEREETARGINDEKGYAAPSEQRREETVEDMCSTEDAVFVRVEGVAEWREDADVVRQGDDDLEGGEGGSEWPTEEPPAGAGGWESDEGGDGNDGWEMGQSSFKEKLLKENMGSQEEPFGAKTDVQTVQDVLQTEVENFEARHLRTEERGAKTQGEARNNVLQSSRTEASAERDGGMPSQSAQRYQKETTSIDGQGDATHQAASTSGKLASTADTSSLPSFASESKGSKGDTAKQAALPSRGDLLGSALPSRLPPRPPKARVGSPFTLHSSVTFVPSPQGGFRGSPDRTPLEGRLSLRDKNGSAGSSRENKATRESVSQQRLGIRSREEEVEGFRGFSRRVEAIVSAAATLGPVWRETRDVHVSKSVERVGGSQHDRASEETRSKLHRRVYADRETERIARIMGMRKVGSD